MSSDIFVFFFVCVLNENSFVEEDMFYLYIPLNTFRSVLYSLLARTHTRNSRGLNNNAICFCFFLFFY